MCILGCSLWMPLVSIVPSVPAGQCSNYNYIICFLNNILVFVLPVFVGILKHAVDFSSQVTAQDRLSKLKFVFYFFYSSLCHSKLVHFCWTQKKMVRRISLTKQFWVPLTSVVFFVHTVEVNRTRNLLVTKILQSMFFMHNYFGPLSQSALSQWLQSHMASTDQVPV